MGRKKILLYADAYESYVGQGANYLNFLSKFGEVLLISSYNDLAWALEHGDVLVVPGGADVNPARYGERPHYATGRANTHYEFLDENLLTPWIHKTNKPVVGICRGLQTINVVLGGTLHQHVVGHAGLKKARDDRWQQMNTVFNIKKNYRTEPLVYKVNSFHHQAIKRLGSNLKMLGWTVAYQDCPSLQSMEIFSHKFIIEDKQIKKATQEYCVFPEIIAHTTKPIIAFQYHPEDINCPVASILIESTINGVNITQPEISTALFTHSTENSNKAQHRE
jgi:gamma-glutamyl-gamma-aminobutyrate hydrolase PuuD